MRERTRAKSAAQTGVGRLLQQQLPYHQGLRRQVPGGYPALRGMVLHLVPDAGVRNFGLVNENRHTYPRFLTIW